MDGVQKTGQQDMIRKYVSAFFTINNEYSSNLDLMVSPPVDRYVDQDLKRAFIMLNH